MGNFVVHGVSHGSIRGQEITISIYVIGVPVTASNWTLSPRGASGKAVSGARWRLTDWSLLPIRIPISLTPARGEALRSVSRWPLWRTERRSWYAACRFPTPCASVATCAAARMIHQLVEWDKETAIWWAGACELTFHFDDMLCWVRSLFPPAHHGLTHAGPTLRGSSGLEVRI